MATREGSDGSGALSPRDQLRLLGDANVARGLHVVATLGVADVLEEATSDVATLARTVGADEDALYRLLRLLASARVFEEHEGRRFRLTAIGSFLRSSSSGSLRESLEIGADDRALWWSIGEMLHGVRTGEPSFERIFGVDFWTALDRGGEGSSRFKRWVSERAHATGAALLAGFDWTSVGTVVDVGGGHGGVLATILAANPALRGVLFDRAHVVEVARAHLDAAGVGDRCDVVGGDFFAGVDARGDVYLVSSVLHHWPDDAAESILRSCRQAGGDTARVLVVDMVVPADDVPAASKSVDLTMLQLCGGRERTEQEFRALFQTSGYALADVVPLHDELVALVGEPLPAEPSPTAEQRIRGRADAPAATV